MEAQSSVHSISPSTTASTFSSPSLGSDISTSVSSDGTPDLHTTSQAGDPHAVSQLEARFYYTGLHSQPKLVYRTGKKWSPPAGPEAQYTLKELCEVFDHPIANHWNHELAWKVVEVLDIHKIFFTTIDIVRFKMIEVNKVPKDEEESHDKEGFEDADDEAVKVKKFIVGPVTIWIGVFPDSASATAAHNAAKDVLTLLGTYHITDVEIDFRESYYTREVGPPLFAPVRDLHPLVEVISSLTPAIGLSISTLARPSAQGTMALYLNQDANNLLGLSCRHVLIGPKEANLKYTYNPRGLLKEVIVLGDGVITSLTNSIKLSIGSLGISVERWNSQIGEFEEILRNGTDPVDIEEAQASMTVTQRLVEVAETSMEAQGALLSRVNKDWKRPNSRVLGHIIHSPAISLGVGDERFTEDWGIFRIDRAKLGTGYQGNKMDLAGTPHDDEVDFKVMSPNEFTLKCYPRANANWKFKYPNSRLLPLQGTLSNHLMCHPDMWDSDSEPCLLVVKNGTATGTTIGRATGVFSIIREYSNFQDMSIHETSMEWMIINYSSKSGVFSKPGDSGSIIADIRGRIGGMLTGGSGKTETSDTTYATPFWWLLERINNAGFHNVHVA